eukprot:Gb_24319 [translate_table: standard]
MPSRIELSVTVLVQHKFLSPLFTVQYGRMENSRHSDLAELLMQPNTILHCSELAKDLRSVFCLCCLRLTKMGSCVSTASKEGDGSCAPEFSRRKKRLAKKALKSFSTDAKNDQRFPRRMCSNGSSKVACVFTQQGRKGINQDAMVVWEWVAFVNCWSRVQTPWRHNIAHNLVPHQQVTGSIFIESSHAHKSEAPMAMENSTLLPGASTTFGARFSTVPFHTEFVSDDTIFCGVFDGHGPYGHLVARRVRDSLPMKLLSFWQSCKEKGNGINGTDTYNNKRKGKTTSKDFGGDISSKEPRLFSAWKDTYLKAYKVMDKELRSQPTIDCFCSGSTAVAVVKQGQYLFIGNVGDSRAILGTKAADDTLIAIQLTVDLKPDLPREAERIQRCKGRVFALQDEPEVHRVWLPHDDAPGLAMARAFGDFCLKEYGVIAIPEVSYRLLTERDQFVVLASDGCGSCLILHITFLLLIYMHEISYVISEAYIRTQFAGPNSHVFSN